MRIKYLTTRAEQMLEAFLDSIHALASHGSTAIDEEDGALATEPAKWIGRLRFIPGGDPRRWEGRIRGLFLEHRGNKDGQLLRDRGLKGRFSQDGYTGGEQRLDAPLTREEPLDLFDGQINQISSRERSRGEC
jgi:hypothetical protein